jgi:hypothetical protein
MISIPAPIPSSPRNPDIILPGHNNDALVFLSPSSVSRNSVHVTALYKKITPTTQQATPAKQIKSRLPPPVGCVTGIDQEYEPEAWKKIPL